MVYECEVKFLRKMSMRLGGAVTAACLLLAPAPLQAAEFAIEFEWGDIPLCGGGAPDIVDNPRFHLEGVPTGTRYISFEMVDLDDPSAHHGGGTVEYWGEETVVPGEFTYRGPCPASGFHIYQWTAKARVSDNPLTKPLAIATARREYP